jgi:ABC-2 type transport system ATP-binding protein
MKAPLSSNILQVEGLTKRYGRFAALNRCSLTIPAGSVFGLLGPNGAGKTTLIRCVLGFLKPTSGAAKIHGFDCVHQSLEVRRRVGYLPAESKLFRLMRGQDCLDFFTSIHPNGNLARALQISKRLDLDLSRRVAFMSTGMRQKLAIACVLGCPSPLMILDEPTANLDPSVRSVVLELVRETRNEGSTFAFCSHILSEIEELCDEVAILRQGSVVHTGQVASIRQIHRMKATTARRIPPEALPPGTKCLAMTDTELLIDLPGTIDRYLDWIRAHGLTGVQMEMVGLRSLYESHHQPAAIPQDGKSG